jgi:hypothetical protein
MKKLSFAVSFILIAVFCIGASIWEGSAAVDIGGELPGSGYYVATKSFPRNTVVDITNLESGKSVRAIVAAGLDSPGLLAILSREAAELLGIQARSIGRVRMTMPQDPVAFSRFTEGYDPSGDPDYDPRALIASAAPWTDSQYPALPSTTVEPVIPPEPFPETVAIPVWEDMDIPVPVTEEVAAISPNEVILPGADGLIPSDTPDPLENVQWPWEFNTDTAVASQVPSPLPVEQPVEPPYVFPDYNWQPPAADYADSAITMERGVEAAPEEISSRTSVAMVPAEPRPPEPYAYTPPASEIAPIASPSEPRTMTWDDIPEDQFIAAIPERTDTRLPEPEPVAEPIFYAEEPVPAAVAANPFSAPLITNLEKGMYYLQVGAFSKTELVESALSRIGDAYPLAVQSGGNSENPLYRILVGPVNLGESSALLQRFRGNGYQDAFVRRDG